MRRRSKWQAEVKIMSDNIEGKSKQKTVKEVKYGN